MVVVTFAVIGLNVVYMIDEKPKTTHQLQRLQNVETLPVAAMLVDHYDDDWHQLWWVRVDGEVVIEKDGGNWWEARSRLKGKYRQYRNAPPSGPAIFPSTSTDSAIGSTADHTVLGGQPSNQDIVRLDRDGGRRAVSPVQSRR